MQEQQETWVQSLGWGDPLEKEMATYSSILAWEIPRQRSLAGYTVYVVLRGRYNLATKSPQSGIAGVSCIAQWVKDPPATQETQVQSLGWEDPLEKGTATGSSILTWRIPWTEEPGEVQSLASQRVRHD